MSNATVDFNNLRLKACNSFDSVVRSLCALNRPESEGVLLDADEANNVIDKLATLRGLITGIAICYDETGNIDVLGDRDLLCFDYERD